MRSRRRLRRRDLCLYALCVEPELTRWEHGPLPSSTKFEPERLERVANTPPLRKDPMNCSPNRWRSAQTSTCGPTTVTKTTQTASITGVAKRGTTAFHAYATLYARVKNKNATSLAVRRLKDGDTASSVPLSSFRVPRP